MCSALVSPHGFKNDVYFTCSVHLFRLMAERYFLSRANWLPRVRLTLARKSCLHRIDRVCLPTFSTPSLLLTLTSGTTDQAPCTHFRFRSRSDSIRLRVKTTRLRSSVLDNGTLVYCSLFIVHYFSRSSYAIITLIQWTYIWVAQ